MKKATRGLSMAIVLAVAAAAPAAAGSGPQVKIPSWKVKTGDGSVHKVSPGGTLKICASHPADELIATGKVKDAQKGKGFSEHWTVDGKSYAKLSETWHKSGSFRTTFGIGAEGFQPGKYRLKLVESSKTIGASTITLKTKKGC